VIPVCYSVTNRPTCVDWPLAIHWLSGWLDEVAVFDLFLSEADYGATCMYNNAKGASLMIAVKAAYSKHTGGGTSR
jgi:hypothetical protein